MFRHQSIIAAICVPLLIPAPGWSAPPAPQDHGGVSTWPESVKDYLSGPYRPRPVPPTSQYNSARLESLLRAGNLYLTIQDAIALALENNLDIQIQRYAPALADTSVMTAEAGGFARGVSTSVTAGPSSASVSASGTTPGATQSAASGASAGTASAVGGSVIQASGPGIPSLDPAFSLNTNFAHVTTPQSSAFVTGTNETIQRLDTSGFAFSKGFLSGTKVSLGL